MSSRSFDVKWVGFANEMSSQVSTLRLSDRFSDISIYCQGQVFLGHKVILAAASATFEKLIVEIPGEKSQVIVLTDVDEEHFRLVMDFMYEGKISVDADMMEGFIKTALKFKVRGLREGFAPSFEKLAERLAEKRRKAKPAPASVKARMENEERLAEKAKEILARVLRETQSNSRPVGNVAPFVSGSGPNNGVATVNQEQVNGNTSRFRGGSSLATPCGPSWTSGSVSESTMTSLASLGLEQGENGSMTKGAILITPAIRKRKLGNNSQPEESLLGGSGSGRSRAQKKPADSKNAPKPGIAITGVASLARPSGDTTQPVDGFKEELNIDESDDQDIYVLN